MTFSRLCLALLLALLVGCGSQSKQRRALSELKTHAEVLEEQVATDEDIARLLETIKDNASAAAVLADLDKLAERSGQLLEKDTEIPEVLWPGDEKHEQFLKQNAELLKREAEFSQRIGKAYAAALKAAPQQADKIKQAMRKTGRGPDIGR